MLESSTTIGSHYGGILPPCESPEGLCGLENATGASVDKAVSRKWVEISVLSELPL